MAHFALVVDGVVRSVTPIDNKDCGGGEFPEAEPVGQEFIASLGLEGMWLQTSYSGSFRANYAAMGGVYDAENDVFYPSCPGDGYTMDETVWRWVTPRGVRIPY